MSRTFRWIYYGQRQREIVLGLIVGSSATIAGATSFAQRPLRAESGSFAEAKAWRSKATVVSHNASLSARSKRDSEEPDTPKVQVPKSLDGQQSPPSQTRGQTTLAVEGVHPDTVTTWQNASDRVANVRDSFTGWDFTELRLKITDVILPSWVRMLPGYVDKLRDELSGAPWSLSWEIWEDAHDPQINPEIVWDAQVRISKELCAEEQEFLDKRRKHTTKALAKYLGVPESEMYPEDVPVIAICGSGGGLRALVAGASSHLCAQEAGLLDCVTYTAGVSGSCWLQTLYNSSIGQQDHARIIEHLKQRLGVHIAYPPAALGLLSRAPTNKFLLSGLVEKLRGVPNADFGLVDIYGLLLAGRLLVPKSELRVSSSDLKISSQQYLIRNGQAPMPIYTAVRHEIPKEMEGHINPSQSAWHNTKNYDWFQWFEWTPYEFFCEELECGIPTWAVGRVWEGGNTVWRENDLALPELRVPLVMGIWGSAFCATLSHYFKEIRPILKAAGLDKLDSALTGKDDDLGVVHPVDPAVIPNFTRGLRDRLPETVSESIHEASHLQLMDAGMSNNLPIYPLLRPGRDVDIIVALDASADVKGDNWLKAVDGYVQQRNIKGWPMGAGWPTEQHKLDDVPSEDTNTAYHPQPSVKGQLGLGPCTIWTGSITHEPTSDPPTPQLSDQASLLSSPHAGISLIYFPFLANSKVPGVDPMTSDFMSTWNFIYTPEEIEKVVALARANFDEGRERTRDVVKGVWERKRKARVEREEQDRREFGRWCRVRGSGGLAL